MHGMFEFRDARTSPVSLFSSLSRTSHVTCVCDVWGAPRPEAFRACEARLPAGHDNRPGFCATSPDPVCSRHEPMLTRKSLKHGECCEMPPTC